MMNAGFHHQSASFGGYLQGAPFGGASGMAPFGGYGMNSSISGGNSNMTQTITNQKPKKVIYIDVNGNQKVYTQREDGDGYVEDVDDERNRNANAVKPILDVENYDGFNYQPAPESNLE